MNVLEKTHLFAKVEKIRIFLLTAALFAMVSAFLLYLLQSKGFFIDESRYDALIVQAGERHNVDPMLIKAVIFRESAFNSKSVGSAGEIGLMQILPAGSVTDWSKFHKRKVPQTVFLFDPAMNIEIGTWYLKRALNRWKDYEKCVELALCQYNAGESRANKWKPEKLSGEVVERITIKSTRMYVKKIMNKYRDYKDAQGL